MSKRSLTNYINEDVNRWRRACKQDEMSYPLSQEDVTYIARCLDSAMSPENLHCDGEISVSQAHAKARRYQKVFDGLKAHAQEQGLTMPQTWEIS
jgi:hypothetical protein